MCNVMYIESSIVRVPLVMRQNPKERLVHQEGRGQGCGQERCGSQKSYESELNQRSSVGMSEIERVQLVSVMRGIASHQRGWGTSWQLLSSILHPQIPSPLPSAMASCPRGTPHPHCATRGGGSLEERERERERRTQTSGVRGQSLREMVTNELLLATPTTRTRALVKKASNPHPLPE